MYKILEAGKLAGNIYKMVVEAPRVAKHCLPAAEPVLPFRLQSGNTMRTSVRNKGTCGC